MTLTHPLALFPLSTVAVGLLMATGTSISAQDDDGAPKSPREFGDVDWGRRIEPALETSARDGKPVMLLFQEVPG